MFVRFKYYIMRPSMIFQVTLTLTLMSRKFCQNFTVEVYFKVTGVCNVIQ